MMTALGMGGVCGYVLQIIHMFFLSYVLMNIGDTLDEAFCLLCESARVKSNKVFHCTFDLPFLSSNFLARHCHPQTHAPIIIIINMGRL